MKRLRTTLALATLAFLAIGYITSLSAQLVNGQLPVTVNEVETRVPFSPQAGIPLQIRPTYGPRFFYCSVPVGQSGAIPDLLASTVLREKLFNRVRGKTAAQLQSLLTQVAAAPDRAQKLILVFDFEGIRIFGEGPGSEPWRAPADTAMKLQTAQEVRVEGPPCYTVEQVDQIIAEGLRVIRAVMQPSTQGQATQKSPAPPPPGGLQKP